MRPPEFTGGNTTPRAASEPAPARFNEAAGIHRRKLTASYSLPISSHRFNEAAGIHRRKRRAKMLGGVTLVGFNEAAGIHRRKRAGAGAELEALHVASMRPPEFTGGNSSLPPSQVYLGHASMRPPEFTGGNLHSEAAGLQGVVASMRPPEFTGGNTRQQ